MDRVVSSAEYCGLRELLATPLPNGYVMGYVGEFSDSGFARIDVFRRSPKSSLESIWLLGRFFRRKDKYVGSVCVPDKPQSEIEVRFGNEDWAAVRPWVISAISNLPSNLRPVIAPCVAELRLDSGLNYD